LRALALDRNQFEGTIPAALARSPLGNIWLKDNKLTGAIPAALFEGTYMKKLVLSNNLLTGTIPEVSNPSSQWLNMYKGCFCLLSFF